MDTNQFTSLLKNQVKTGFIEPLQVRLMMVFEYIWENQLLFPGSWVQETIKMLLDLDPDYISLNPKVFLTIAPTLHLTFSIREKVNELEWDRKNSPVNIIHQNTTTKKRRNQENIPHNPKRIVLIPSKKI
jgi:hypothetical protein